MYNYVNIILLFILTLSCSSEKSADNGTNETDTIYADTHYLKNRDYYKSRRPIIKVARVDDSYVDFKIGRTDTVRIEVSNFRQYDTEVRNTKNVILSQVEKDLYLVTLQDSIFGMEIWQNYDPGKVILKRFDRNEQAHYSNYVDWRIVGKVEFQTE